MQAFNVTISHVKVIHNWISHALSTAPLGGPKVIERVLNTLRGHALFAYNRIVSSVGWYISPKVIEDPSLDKLWDSAGQTRNTRQQQK